MEIEKLKFKNPNIYFVLVTKNLQAQRDFYRDILSLEVNFENDEVVTLGREDVLELVIRKDQEGESHHRLDADNKGPFIPTFRFEMSAKEIEKKLPKGSYRGKYVDKYGESTFLFIEDADKNEICLDCKN